MTLNKTAAKLAVLISLSLLIVLFSCGELSTSLFSSGGTYHVRALVNGNSLESCSLIRQDDKIIPYFAVSVVNDPDLMGLLVYLKNSKGDIAGERVLYTIEPVEDAIQPEEIKSEDIDSEDNDSEVSEDYDSEDETTAQTETETPKLMERRAAIDTKPAVKKYDTAILIKSFEQEMPAFILPKSLEIGTYSLVFEAVGRSNTLSLTEIDIFYLGDVDFRLNDISTYLPWLSDTRLIPPSAPVMLEAGLDFDSRLNPYVIWYNGKNIISEGRIKEGAGNILWKAPEQPGFYSLRLEVLPYHLKRNFTGLFREITIPVSAKASQTGYLFGSEPDYPAQRPLVAGTVYPEQVKLVTAQIAAHMATPVTARLVSSTIAENADKPAPVMPPPPELIRWYRFDGSLDEVSSMPDRIFETANDKVPRWASAGQSYGLSVGPDDTYFLKPIKFFRQTQDREGGGIFLFHVRPVTEGTIFSAFFPTLASANDGVWMDITARKDVITLRLKTKNASVVEMPVNMGNIEEQGLIPIVVEFYIRPYRFEAKISLGEDLFTQSMTGEIRLPGALEGGGRIRLGVDKTAPNSTAETKSIIPPYLAAAKPAVTQTPLETEPLSAAPIAGDIPIETVQPESTDDLQPEAAAAAVVAALTTVWDEFAVLYLTTPLLPEEIFIEDNDSVETEDPQNEEATKPPIKTQAAVETRRESGASVPPEERVKPNSADPSPGPANAKPAEKIAPVEDEALTEIKAEVITEIVPIEQEQTETENEEAESLISLP
jgi:hypothetical protein